MGISLSMRMVNCSCRRGLQSVYADVADRVEADYGLKLTRIGQIGFSAMMHGYLAFDADGELLVPFRTWQNTNTSEAHEKLSELFQYNIPERWSIAHLYQAVLDNEPHIGSVRYFTTLSGYVHWKLTGRKVLGIGDASGMFPIDPGTKTLDNEPHIGSVRYFTTLSGYVHWKLTGRKVLGIGDASGMFPIDPGTKTYEQGFIEQFDALPEVAAQPWKLNDLLPEPLVAGTPAGELTPEGAALLDPSGVLQPGTMLAPPEGDAGTGMVATNSVRRRTGNVSAGTSIFATVVLEHKLSKLRPEVDLVTTPAGDLAGMSHANNFTADLNGWVDLFRQFSQLNGRNVDDGTLYGELFRAAIGEDADPDAGGLLAYPFRTGEFLAGLAEGRPLFVRGPEARFSLANFMRAQLFGAFSPVTIGMNVMTEDEGVEIDSLVGHGGIFATPVVAQRILAAAFNTPIRVMTTASEGGAWGMAVLADYLRHADLTLADYLDDVVFAGAESVTEAPRPDDVDGFQRFFARFVKALPVERSAVEHVEIGG